MTERDNSNHLLWKVARQWKIMPEKTLMDQARTLFWLADGGGRLIYVNGAFYRQFGAEGGSAGKNLQEMIPRDMAVFFFRKTSPGQSIRRPLSKGASFYPSG
jgi:PAS domain-containing protein